MVQNKSQTTFFFFFALGTINNVLKKDLLVLASTITQKHFFPPWKILCVDEISSWWIQNKIKIGTNHIEIMLQNINHRKKKWFIGFLPLSPAPLCGEVKGQQRCAAEAERWLDEPVSQVRSKVKRLLVRKNAFRIEAGEGGRGRGGFVKRLGE